MKFALRHVWKREGHKKNSLTRVYGIHTLDCLLQYPSSVSKWTKYMLKRNTNQNLWESLTKYIGR